ncbi:DUF1754-domain-containing protein [Fomitopsis betulina]|nr:DUF1754-domain-containing protein [Fomitopsis betulina]
MSDYDFRPGGALKLRGVAEGGIVKKKKKSKAKSRTKEKEKSAEPELAKELELLKKEDDKSLSPSGSGRNSPAIATASERKTPAEKRFEEVQRKRLAERVTKLAHQTHKDRVHEFNSKLEALSEHHDIPKVGPG